MSRGFRRVEACFCLRDVCTHFLWENTCFFCSLLLMLGVGFVVNNYGQTHATDIYYSAIKAQDYATAYAYLGSNVKTGLSLEAFTQKAQQNDVTEGRVSRFGFSNVPHG